MTILNIDIMKMMTSLYTSALILTLCLTALCTTAKAQVNVTEEAAITQLMNQYKSNNRQKSIVRAWRIQILTTSDRRQMEEGIKKFEMLYPDVKYTWEHNAPYYQVRIGAYELKEDLEATLLELKQHFPSALPVQSEMQKTDLLKY